MPAARAVVTGVQSLARNKVVRGLAATAVPVVIGAARERLPVAYRSRHPIVAVTGLAGSGKTVLVHQACSRKADYTPLEFESPTVEKRSWRSGLSGMRFRIIPGGDVAARRTGFEQLFHSEPVDGVVHVVADGLATARPGSPEARDESMGLDAYRALQREREVEDFRQTATHIASLVGESRKPIWLLIAVTKTDLLHPHVAADIVENYYSLHGHSPFADVLRDLRRRVGDAGLTTAVMPVYALAEDFEFGGHRLATRGTPADRDAKLDAFRHRVRHLAGQVS
ncbi:hypothetical protein [Pseudonocardia humida]|uniref:50S ribosome-binding GTPase n=1 Tax=Pseudonocardia humida TaxID=2800819 RepID=A0ABT1A3U3_9PSEU|nr:hypothetical protein [Pseudonocardia humida]MCO1657672.1 hypothetical protein [Pseudonocardia humida]